MRWDYLATFLLYFGVTNPHEQYDLSPYRLCDSSTGPACTFKVFGGGQHATRGL